MSRPLVGVTGPDHGGTAAWTFTRLALRRAGARAVRITPSHPCDPQSLDALVIGGGADVAPELYAGPETSLSEVIESAAEAPESDREGRRARLWAPLLYLGRRLVATGRYTGLDTDRDRLEIDLIEAARARLRPVLGICRGAQLINVSFGGSLHQDLSDFYVESPNPWTVLPKKPVTIAEGSRLATLLNGHRAQVNALHKQAIKDVAPDLAAVAHEDNGVIQAVEAAQGFCLGLQWHPEYMPQSSRQQAVFRGLVQACG